MQQKAVSRRSVVAAGATAVGAAALLGVRSALAETSVAEEATESFSVNRDQKLGLVPDAAPHEEQHGFHVDTQNCVACGHCVRACRKAHGMPDDSPAYRTLVAYTNAAGEEVHLSSGCMHCENPACADVCPAGAITKGAGGIVSVDPDRCIGCRYCFQACPFGVPQYGPRGMEKCDACLSVGVVAGQETTCARSCKYDALHYGALPDLQAKYPDAKRVESVTGPAYLVS